MTLPEPAERNPLLDDLVREWVAEDPVAASQFALEQHAEPIRDDLLRRVARFWAPQDPLTALAWAAGVADAALRQSAVHYFASAAAGNNPEIVLEALVARSQTADQGELVARIAAEWARVDAPSALRWAEALPPDLSRQRAIAHIATAWASSRPFEAVQLILSRLPDTPRRSDALIAVLHQWAQSDFDAALAWSGQLPQGPLYDRALRELDAAAKRLLANTPGPARTSPEF